LTLHAGLIARLNPVQALRVMRKWEPSADCVLSLGIPDGSAKAECAADTALGIGRSC